ncbi:ribosome hibernation-promoting factor, HPF/YfiA family [Atopobacter phocae]|uniref:ribosome hibernation-promoting factor, HPF/YfiA family n=1 Tax=Atopobacter phocae TaxID=136492 RepID=UPI0004701959|nr:ribosome-associated translation inhibitor RaiA [Atopobacter phocae]
MFKYNMRGENIEVTEAIRSYATKRLSKLEKYFTDVPDVTAHVNFKVYSDKKAKVEVTIPFSFLVLRAEETSPDLYASIDLVVDKLERQVRKYKTRINRKARDRNVDVTLPVFEEVHEEHEQDGIEIVRKKRFNLKPMDTEEAVMQMNMLGHSFFVYEDSETGGINIVYQRKDNKYGLIETDNF